MPLVVFRCDANSLIGIGHVMRCLTLATEMQEQGWQTLFICEKGSSSSCLNLLKSSHKVIEIENVDVQDVLDAISGRGYDPVDLYVIDHYGIDYHFESILRTTGSKVMVIDDLCNRSHDCDILLDQTFARHSDEYEKFTPFDCKILAGSSYTLLRRQFEEAREKSFETRRLRLKNGIQSVLLTFGGTDQTALILRVLDGLDQCERDFQVDVVLNDLMQVHKIENSLRDYKFLNCTLHCDVDDMASLMSRTDIAIAAGGTTSWERCCLGLPTFSVLLAENQIEIVQNLEHVGAVLNLGWSEGVSAALIKKEIICFSYERQSEMSTRARSICDGKGCETVVSYINQLFE